MKLVALIVALSCGLAPAGNLIVNPSFEYWLFGAPVGWLTSNPISESSVVRSTNAHSGQYCALLAGKDTTAFVSTATVVRQGFHYRFGAFCRVPSMMPSSVVLQFTTLLADPVGNPVLIPAYYSGSNYREYSRWITAPESAALLSVTFVTLTGGTAYLDDVTLEDTTILGVAEERPPVLSEPHGVRKLVVPRSGAFITEHGTSVLDPSGRRWTGILKPGVYFILKERRPE